MKRALTPLVCYVAGLLLIAAGLSPTIPTRAAQKPSATSKPSEKIRRILPEDIPGLPPEFVEKLKERNCSVPQFDEGTAGSSSEPNNVIHGEFAKAGQQDWAVLCSNGQTSTIVIFWGKVAPCPASLARLDDAHYLKAAAGKTMHYSRAIRGLGEEEIGERAGMKTLRPLKHQGIDDRFVGKSSAFFYCNEGKWRIFPAKDTSGE
jgi:hypothetical protein